MPSAGSQHRHLQKYRPTMKPLVVIKNVGEEQSPDIKFRVPIPDSRLRVKITLAFAFDADNQPSAPGVDLTLTASLWLSETEDDDSGATGTTYPATDVEGTEAGPTSIPKAIGLTAYSREFETAADNIEGVFNATNASGFTGSWILMTRYQPAAGQRFSQEEWEEIIANAKPICPPPFVL